MREDEASGQSSEKYDYKFDSSFEGDLDYTGLGGSVDASLNFEGSSTDVRDSASKAAMNAVQKHGRPFLLLRSTRNLGRQ
jgi:hypothetical protein